MLRRFRLYSPTETHKNTMDRFTRLAVGIFKTNIALISIVGKDEQAFLSNVRCEKLNTGLDSSLCAHSIVGTGRACFIAPNANMDWRFQEVPLVDEGRGISQSHASAPLKFGGGFKAAIIGCLCLIDDRPREFEEDARKVLSELAMCVVSEVSLPCCR